MLISDVWTALAAAHAIEFAPADDERADMALRGPNLAPTLYDVKVLQQLKPSQLGFDAPASQDEARPLLVVPAASDTTRSLAEKLRISLLVAGADQHVTGMLFDRAGRSFRIDAWTPGAEPAPATPRVPRGRAPWGEIAAVIALLSQPRVSTQSELAARLGLTQGRISQIMSARSFVRQSPAGGWQIDDAGAAATWLRSAYRQPRVQATWLSLDDPVPAARQIAAALDRRSTPYAVAGQVAADAIAPWARPTRTVIWAPTLVDLGELGCVPAPAATASIAVAVPEDPYAIAAASRRSDILVADPWRTWLSMTASDEVDAAEHLFDKIAGIS